MNVYKTEDVRNVVLLGHGGCGKTTLVEAMAYVSGAISRQGKVDDGSTLSDFDKEEIKRQFSINTSVVPIVWENTKLNILDTPGYFDFVGEVESAVSAADAAVIVVSGAVALTSADNILYALIVVFVSTKLSEVILMGLDKSKLCIIITNKGKEIAQTLFLSEGTVRNYLSSTLEKLELRDRTQLAIYYYKHIQS